MDQDNRPEDLAAEQWLDELLRAPEITTEIGADEQAVAAAGLTHPDDLEFEKIMKETLNENWNADAAMQESELPVPDFTATMDLSALETFKDDEFRDTFGEGEVLKQVFSSEPMPKPEETAAPIPEESELPQKETEEEPPVQKGRPKRKQGYGLFGLPHLAAAVIWLLIIVAIGVSAGRMVWICATDVLAFGREPISATVTINEGDTIDVIAGKLKDAGLIEYPGLFKLYADISNAAEKFRPGTYEFTAVNADNETIVYDYMALKSVLTPHSSGLVVVEDLRIPEGYTCRQIFQLLEENKVCTVAELEEYAANGELDDYWFLEDVTRGDKYCLEGYLFPNTYDFYENDDPERVLEKMLDAFDANFTDVMKDHLDNLEKLDGYTLREVVIIASMIEKETANNPESFTISSVIYNRLNNSSKYPYLNIDATIVYALDGKSDLTAEDLKIDHPYNTYINPGLTPGPISNPSQNSLAAALDPEETGYYYYAYDPAAGEHHFSKTYEEHLKFLDSLED